MKKRRGHYRYPDHFEPAFGWFFRWLQLLGQQDRQLCYQPRDFLRHGGRTVLSQSVHEPGHDRDRAGCAERGGHQFHQALFGYFKRLSACELSYMDV